VVILYPITQMISMVIFVYFLSEGAVIGVESPGSMRLKGHIQGHDMLILVDSGVHTLFSVPN
jgi:hypothetical protein